jgi:uncharacterized protein (TIGR02145 family)
MIEPVGKDQIFIRKLSDIIVTNLGNENFGVKELAHESGISQYTLSRRLYFVTRKTINQFILETRLLKALEMLQNENLNISEVADRVGFSSLDYFNKCFFKFFGYPAGKINKSGSGNAREINSYRVTAGQGQKKGIRKALIILSSGVLSVALIAYVVLFFLIKKSSPDASEQVKNRDKSVSNKKDSENTVTDIDGNVYRIVTIGTQVWMAEDLKTTRYNDGTPIPNITDNTEWVNFKSGAYCWPNNDESNKTKFGALYNWYATGNKLCPVGWHVSTARDWEILVDLCGGWEIAGTKLKETGFSHWDSTNIAFTNEFGFTSLPSWTRFRDGRFRACNGSFVGYWCPPRYGDFRSLGSGRTWIYISQTVPYEGYCVRCVKDK